MSQDEAWIDALLAKMTLAEKASLTAGADNWHSTSLPRLDIPAFKMSDGPNGVRGDGETRGSTSLNFPVGAALGATWSTELLLAVGDALGQEAQDKDVQVLLGPTVNIQRLPIAGRNFECYSEDPLLTAELAVSFVKGVQGRGVAACVKHFVANDSERDRMRVSSQVGERALREIYLRPFAAAVARAGAWAVMSAYNRVNGEYASESQLLLTDVLKREWGFDGVVISDWFGTYNTPAPAVAGMDLEMPGPARFLGARLQAAVQEGTHSMAALDDSVRRLLRMMKRTNRLEREHVPAEKSIDRPEHRALARRVVHESTVMLKNNGVLPLKAISKIALIGPNADAPQYQGGGSSALRAHYLVSPLAGLVSAPGVQEVTLARGCSHARYVPLPDIDWLSAEQGAAAKGWSVTFHAGLECAGAPLHRLNARRSELLWFGRPAPKVPAQYSAVLRSELRVRQSGKFQFGLVNAGKARLFLNEQLLVDNWSDVQSGDAFLAMGSREVRAQSDLLAEHAYQVRVEFACGGQPIEGVRIGIAPPEPPNEIAQAVAQARDAEVAIVCVGLSADWESEGFDRQNMELPGRQVELIRSVAAANAKTVVVINAGSPIDTGEWAGDVAAILQVWYPGQEFGNGLADILCGLVSPSGRLPLTLPQVLATASGMDGYPGTEGRLAYSDELNVGYRGYEARGVIPAFPFGFGLTYGTFVYSNLETVRSRVAVGEDLDIGLTLQNAGEIAAQEVVQLYVGAIDSMYERPLQELKAFAKVALAAGESRQVRLRVRGSDLSVYDVAKKSWVAEACRYRLSVGASSSDERLSTVIEIAGR